MLHELEYPFDSEYILKKSKSLKRRLLEENTQRIPKKIAVLGGSAAEDYLRALPEGTIEIVNYDGATGGTVLSVDPALATDGGSASRTGGEHAGELATRDDVETGAEAREHRQDAEVRVGLDRIAHQRAATGQRLLPGAEGGLERGLRVHIGGRAEARGDVCERQVFEPQRALTGVERGDRPGGRAGGGSVHSIRGSESRSCGTMGLL